MPRMTSKSTISHSTRSAEVTFWETMTRQFLYTCLAITGSPTGVETEKGSEIVSWMTLNWTAILSYKRQSHLCCLSTEWTICESHPWVCRMPISPITMSYWHHTKYFLDLINELLWVLTNMQPQKLWQIHPNKITNSALFWLVILWTKRWIGILKLYI